MRSAWPTASVARSIPWCASRPNASSAAWISSAARNSRRCARWRPWPGPRTSVSPRGSTPWKRASQGRAAIPRREQTGHRRQDIFTLRFDRVGADGGRARAALGGEMTHVESLPARPHPVDRIEQIAAANDWPFERANDDEITVAVGGEWSDYHLSITWMDTLEA